MLPTLVIIIPNLEIFLFCQHNSTGGGNLELRQIISAFINDCLVQLPMKICQIWNVPRSPIFF
jgi:hypothetical protein